MRVLKIEVSQTDGLIIHKGCLKRFFAGIRDRKDVQVYFDVDGNPVVVLSGFLSIKDVRGTVADLQDRYPGRKLDVRLVRWD